MPELHARTQQRHNTQEWVDQRSQRTHEEYNKVIELGETSGSQPEVSDNFATWEKVVGSRKKSQIYGIGAVAQATPSSYYSCSVDSVTGLAEAGLQMQVELLSSSFDEHMRKMEAQLQEARFEIDVLSGKLQQQVEPSEVPTEPAVDPEEEASTESEQDLV